MIPAPHVGHSTVPIAQKLLLDRPVSREQTPSLAVEVITDEEGRLLSVYRSLRLDMRRAHATAMP